MLFLPFVRGHLFVVNGFRGKIIVESDVHGQSVSLVSSVYRFASTFADTIFGNLFEVYH